MGKIKKRIQKTEAASFEVDLHKTSNEVTATSSNFNWDFDMLIYLSTRATAVSPLQNKLQRIMLLQTIELHLLFPHPGLTH